MGFQVPRMMTLSGGCNLRDLGGHGTADGRVVRHGVLYRSGVLTYLTPSDHNCVSRARIRTIVDLRRSSEIADEPTHWPLPVRILSFAEHADRGHGEGAAPWEGAIAPDAARRWMFDSYTTMPLWLAPALSAILQAILDEEMPVLFHCSAGKDRTGFCAAIILRLLGVSEEAVLDDFAFTDIAVDLRAFSLTHRTAGLGVLDRDHPINRIDPAALDALLRADRAYLQAALDRVAADYGSIEDYARRALGLDDAALAAIRFQLLDEWG